MLYKTLVAFDNIVIYVFHFNFLCISVLTVIFIKLLLTYVDSRLCSAKPRCGCRYNHDQLMTILSCAWPAKRTIFSITRVMNMQNASI